MKVVRKSEYSEREYFTGKVNFLDILGPEPPRKLFLVSFAPGARTFWHTHAGEQILYVVEGQARVQKQGAEAFDLNPGDVVYIEPNEMHWHGAKPGSGPMTHLAITIGASEWYQEVSDGEYG